MSFSAAIVNGVSTIEMITIAVRIAFCSAVMIPTAAAAAVQHEGELAALRHQHGALERFRVRRAQEARHGVDRDGLHEHVGDDVEARRAASSARRRRDRATCRRRGRTARAGCRGTARRRLRADGGSVDSDSSTPARNAPIAIDKPPTCISKRRAEHDEQRRRRHHFARLRSGQDAEQRVQHVAPDDDEPDDRADSRCRSRSSRARPALGCRARSAPGTRRPPAAARS